VIALGTERLRGVRVELDGRPHILPPMSLGALQRYQDRISAFKGGMDKESIGLVVSLAHASIVRNYPEATLDEVGDLIDLGNMLEVFEAVMDVSGTVRKAQETAASAEAQGD